MLNGTRSVLAAVTITLAQPYPYELVLQVRLDGKKWQEARISKKQIIFESKLKNIMCVTLVLTMYTVY